MDNLLHKTPNWLRWILAFPLAVIIPILMGIIWKLSSSMYVDPSSLSSDCVQLFILGVGFTSILSAIVPKYNLAFAVTALCIIVGLIAVYTTSLFILGTNVDWFTDIISSLAMVGGSIFAVYTTKQFTDEENNKDFTTL